MKKDEVLTKITSNGFFKLLQKNKNTYGIVKKLKVLEYNR